MQTIDLGTVRLDKGSHEEGMRMYRVTYEYEQGALPRTVVGGLSYAEAQRLRLLFVTPEYYYGGYRKVRIEKENA